MRRLGAVLCGLALAGVGAQAQTVVIGVKPASLAAPVIVFPASAVNGAGVTAVPLQCTDGSAAAPCFTFASAPTYGFDRVTASGGGIGVVLNAGEKLRFDATAASYGVVLDPATVLAWNSATLSQGSTTTADLTWGRASAGVLSMNGVNTVAFVAADFTTTSVSLATITGLSWTLPANTARNVPFSCKLSYSQSTAAVADAFGFQVATVAPTSAQVLGSVNTAAGVNGMTNGAITVTTTTATNIVTFTPGAIATVFNAYIDGFIEAPSNAGIATVNIMALTGNASDALTVKRGSFCRIY